jgi:hypothetical protein
MSRDPIHIFNWGADYGWVELVWATSERPPLVLARQNGRFMKKARIIDLRDEKVCHIGT